MKQRLRALLGGGGGFSVVAALLLTVGVLITLLWLQLPSSTYWRGIEVRGTTKGGITTYVYRGETFTVDNPHLGADQQGTKPTTVFLNRGDPRDTSRVLVDSPVRWLDAGFVVFWYAGALVVFAAGQHRRFARVRRRDQAVLDGEAAFGHGLDPEAMERYVRYRDARHQ